MPSKQDADTISKMYTLYEQSMFYEAKAILHDDYLAEDAVHEAFLRLVRNVGKINDITSDKTKSYVKKILRSAAIDIYRQNKRDRENCETLDEKENDIACDEEAYNHISPLVDSLSDKYRSVFRCIAVHGLSARETAFVLRISEVCVRKRYERAKRLLKDMLAGQVQSTYIMGKENK